MRSFLKNYSPLICGVMLVVVFDISLLYWAAKHSVSDGLNYSNTGPEKAKTVDLKVEWLDGAIVRLVPDPDGIYQVPLNDGTFVKCALRATPDQMGLRSDGVILWRKPD